MQVKLVIGPPGTGKTTHCLNLVNEYLARGVPPYKIAFLSFTKQAAREASERAMERFNLPERQFLFFRTLHSLAWRLNNMQWEQAFKDADWRKFGLMMDITFSAVLNKKKRADSMLEPEECQTEGDHLARIEQFSRVMGITLEESYQKYCETDMSYMRLEQYTRSFNAYKAQRGIKDYIDLINECNKPLDVDLAIFDEAQDMTPQQFRMAERITVNVPNVLYAGDDMQAIFAWAGADVGHFINVTEQKLVLPKSYRLPQTIFDLAKKLENRIERNYERSWVPNEKKEGKITRVSSLASLPLHEGNWLLIGRNWKTLDEQYVQHLKANGYPYLLNTVSSLEAPEVLAVLDYETARKGIPISHDSAMRIFKFIEKKDMPDLRKETYVAEELDLDLSKNWMEALNLIAEYDREYIRALLRAGYKLRERPKIRVDTIHGTKGSECENVAILLDMSQQSYKSYMKNPDAEVRLFYTGVTRAKTNLYIVEPQTNMHFDL